MTSPLPQPPERAEVEPLLDSLDTLLADGDVSVFLYVLVRQAVGLLDGAAVGLMVTDRLGRLRLAAASDARPSVGELLHLQMYRRSPVLECLYGGEPVAASPLDRFGSRWPSFVPAAQMLGFHAVHALPIRAPDVTVGVLSLLREPPLPLPAQALVRAEAVADTAAAGLRQQQLLAREDSVVEQVRTALEDLAVIEQAKGVLASRGNVDVDEAFARLYRHARAHHRQLSGLAREVVTDPKRAATLAAGSTD